MLDLKKKIETVIYASLLPSNCHLKQIIIALLTVNRKSLTEGADATRE